VAEIGFRRDVEAGALRQGIMIRGRARFVDHARSQNA
jgi:hypothetical protein